MPTLFLRTLLIYLLLLLAMRLMGKRQIGSLEISDLATTILISELAALPITDPTIPLNHAVIPISLLVAFEILSSLLLARHPRIKSLLTPRPTTLIRNGKLDQKAMREARLSADELISELRQKDFTNLSEIRYAILEQNGKITVIPYARHRPPTADQLRVALPETGLHRIVIDKGTLNHHSLQALHLNQTTLLRILNEQNLTPKDVYLMLINDAGEATVIPKQK